MSRAAIYTLATLLVVLTGGADALYADDGPVINFHSVAQFEAEVINGEDTVWLVRGTFISAHLAYVWTLLAHPETSSAYVTV
jgi:ureidoglycolate hydrolase